MSPAIYNFLIVDDRLWTGGQPNEQHLEWLSAQGCEIVINVGQQDAVYALADEAQIVQRLRMAYVYLPIDFERPRRQHFTTFVESLDACGQRKTFIHCASNKRAAVLVALYAQLRWRWTEARADALIARVWEPDAPWQRLIESVRLGFASGHLAHGSAPR